MPLDAVVPKQGAAFLKPNPRTVSLELMTRPLPPARELLKLMAAYWIQFMVNEGMSHGKNEKENPIDGSHTRGRRLAGATDGRPRTRRDPTRPPTDTEKSRTFVNSETHWWTARNYTGTTRPRDESALGQGRQTRHRGDDGLLPVEPSRASTSSGVTCNWWGAEHAPHVFTLEHNASLRPPPLEEPPPGRTTTLSTTRARRRRADGEIHTIE